MVVSTQSSNTHTPYWWLHPNRGARKEGRGGVDRWMDLVLCSACCALFFATTLLCWTCIVISPSWTPLSSRPHKRQLIAPLMSLFARLEICRDRRDRRSCKIFVSCVNFSRKQRSFSYFASLQTPKCKLSS